MATISSSDLSRAKETCKIALGFQTDRVKIDRRLREIYFGDFEGSYYGNMDKSN